MLISVYSKLFNDSYAHSVEIYDNIYNPHLEFMGAKTMQRAEFLQILERKIKLQSGFESFKNLLDEKHLP